MLEAVVMSYPSTGVIRALPHRTLISLRAFKGCDEQLCAALGVALPQTPRQIEVDGVRYLWAGPRSWLVCANDPDLAARFSSYAHLAAITEQADGHALFAVGGSNARQILAKLIPIDLHESAFPQDAVALTLAGHIAVKLWREDDEFVLACFRSFGAALWYALTEAA